MANVHQPSLRHINSGSVLVMVLAVLLISTLLSMSILQTAQLAWHSIHYQTVHHRVFWAAEATLKKAQQELKQGEHSRCLLSSNGIPTVNWHEACQYAFAGIATQYVIQKRLTQPCVKLQYQHHQYVGRIVYQITVRGEEQHIPVVLQSLTVLPMKTQHECKEVIDEAFNGGRIAWRVKR